MITRSEGRVFKIQHRCQNTLNIVFPGKLLFINLWVFIPDWVEGEGRNNNNNNNN